jgi:DNA-binding CsgD family transcriptional regulator/nucleoside-triphosphatase THEP1
MPTRRDLVGRQAELAQLTQMLTGDTERAVVVSGEPGVGKTALIEQLCARAAADAWQVVRVLGVAAEEPFALGGLNQLAFGLKTYQAKLDDVDRAVLAPVFGGDPDSEVAVLPLASGLLNLLAVAGQQQSLLLVVDDVHWLDRVSAEVLGAVGRRLTHPQVRIVAVLRTSHDSGFSSAGWDELPLAPLDAEDSLMLLESAGVPVPAANKTAIITAAQGNPLALVELPRFGGRIEERLGALPLTERLVAVFGAQLEALDAGVRAELLRAALDGIAGSVPSSTGARFVMRNVASAVKAGLLVVNPLGDIVFRHPLVRAAVIHQADPQERREAHRDLAGIYDEVLVRRASHLAAAALEPDQDVADVLARAAKLSIRRGGLSVGAEWLSRAAELSTDPDRRAELFADAVFVAARTGQPGVEDLLEGTGTSAGESALAVLADSYRLFHAEGEVTSTHRRVLDALNRADTLDDKTVNRLAYLLVSITNYSGSLQHREQTNAALLNLEKRLDPAVLMYRTGIEDIAGTANAVRSMLSGYVELLPQVPAQRMVLLSFPAYCLGVMANFRAPLQRAYAQLSSHGASIDAIESGRVVLLDLIAAGHWRQGEQVGADCLEMAQEIEGSQLRRHQLLADLGGLAAAHGDVETARSYAAEVTAWSKTRGLQRLIDAAGRIALRVGLAEADYEAAYHAASGISPPGHWPHHNIHEVGEYMLDVVEAAVQTGHLDEARALAAEAVGLNLAALSPRVALLTIAISAMTSPDSEAGELYQSALTHPGIAEFPFEHARIFLAQGMWLRRMRRYTEARAALSAAAESFDRLGSRPWAERARAELRAAGASVKQSLGEAAPLSAQERRIAELAADGRTTKEIAAQLSISARTVDGHLYRLFRKLGITSRAGLSKALQRPDSDARIEF